MDSARHRRSFCAQVLFWLLELLDLAIEYENESNMGVAELASVFVPWLVPEPRGQLMLAEKVLYETKKKKFSFVMVRKARLLLDGYQERYKDAAPKPPAEQLWKAAAEGASGFHLRQPVRVAEQDRLSLLERCCKSCAPGGQGQSNT